MSFENRIKRLATVWTNTSGSHSDDLLEEIVEILQDELGFTPKEYPYNMSFDTKMDTINKEFSNG